MLTIQVLSIALGIQIKGLPDGIIQENIIILGLGNILMFFREFVHWEITFKLEKMSMLAKARVMEIVIFSSLT